MQHGLTGDELARYRKDGFVFPVPALSTEQVSYFLDQFHETKRMIGPRASTVDIRHPQLFFRWVYEIATCPSILDAVSAIVGDDILLTRGAVFFKEPHSAVAHPLHQDAYCLGFTREHSDLFVTAWIALTPSTAANGGLRMYPGTQYDQYTYNKPTLPWSVRNAVITDQFDAAREVPVELPAGSMSLHHANVVHHSGANKTDSARVGVVMRYAATCVRQHVPIKQPALLVRGRDTHGLYELADPPTEAVAGGIVRMRKFINDVRLRAQSQERQSIF